MKKTGFLIAELRREAGYTQKTLAEALNITDKAIEESSYPKSSPKAVSYASSLFKK